VSLKLNVGCNCCAPTPCCVCNPVFPSSLYTGDFDVTFTGFFNSIDCDYCEFLENTFTLECSGGHSGYCFNLPADYDITEIPCHWGITFTEDADDRGCSISDYDYWTGYNLDSDITWTDLMLTRYKIDNGVDDPYPHWRLQVGYVMNVSVWETVLDADGNPVIRGTFTQKCNDFYYDFPMSSSAFPARCTLTSSDIFTQTTPASITATYGGVTNTNSLSDWCSSIGSVDVEAVLV